MTQYRKPMTNRFACKLLAAGSLCLGLGGVMAAPEKSIAETGYPPVLHGVWFDRTAEGRSACKLYRRHADGKKLGNATVISATRWTEVSEGESSYSSTVKVEKAGVNRWHFVEHFHLNEANEFTETQTEVRLPARGVMKQTFQFTDNGVVRKSTRVLFKCV
ncbi:hypothetical protein [Hydrogenophaga sp. RWCD_12]|uniref:hypothetical protein n=1 Tax=Hydrogenophaga sp. RWCD_12 TaxID=3391190 RepID=UPI003984CC4E